MSVCVLAHVRAHMYNTSTVYAFVCVCMCVCVCA